MQSPSSIFTYNKDKVQICNIQQQQQQDDVIEGRATAADASESGTAVGILIASSVKSAITENLHINNSNSNSNSNNNNNNNISTNNYNTVFLKQHNHHFGGIKSSDDGDNTPQTHIDDIRRKDSV